MKKKCQKCGEEYTIGQLSFDPGLCKQCKPGFLGIPLWMQSCEAGTRDLWGTLLVIHIVLLFLSGLILDCGALSVPLGIYCMTVIAYLTVRVVIARIKGFPVLTKCQSVMLLLLPVWGPVYMIPLFYLVQRLRWGA